MMKYILKFQSDSYLKTFPLNPDKLSGEDLIAHKAGEEIYVSEFTPNLQGNHIQVILEDFDPDSTSIETIDKLYYCLQDEVEIFLSEVSFGEGDSQQFPPPLPQKVNLDVPYHTQHNNIENPSGACNVTCMAMVLKYYGVDSRTQADLNRDVQLEDVLYRKTREWDIQYGFTGGTKTRHDPNYLIRLVREWGDQYGNGALPNSYFKLSASEANMKQHIAKGNPVVVHGYFTNYGHIIVVKGYDDTTGEWICNDPNGQWLGYRGGYNRSASGANVRYRYTDVREVCDYDGIWCHFPVPRVMRLGSPVMEGAEIKKLQSALKQKGFSIEETGLYDDKTKAVVEEFQGKNGLVVDGVAGPNTWSKLFASIG